MHLGIVESFFLIFAGATLLAAGALFTRQPLVLAYIVVGCLLGPHVLGWVDDATLLAEIAEIGIIFLLFLVGLDLQPSKLKNMLGESVVTAVGSSAIFFGLGFGAVYAFGYTVGEASVAGIASMFSSTIMGIKLLPTTVLHHRHIGEIVVSLLLIQDLIAILALLALAGYAGDGSTTAKSMALAILALPAVGVGMVLCVRWIVLPLIQRFDAFNEFIFLLAVGWCLAGSTVASWAGLSFEIGAFIAGVTLATSPIAQYIAESLRPLRDFFLVMFFFTVGAAIDPTRMLAVLLPTIALALLLVLAKPVAFRSLLGMQGETPEASWETGFRLGQASEFSLLVTYVASSVGLIAADAAHIVQGATVLTLVLSTYLVIFRYPSPIAVNENLRRD